MTNLKISKIKNCQKTLKSEVVFIYDKKSVTISEDDCISFLHRCKANSIDLIVTDPAYSGMNNRLKLGRGRIVGKYSEKGTENGKWFGEFEDTKENYVKFLSACKRVLKKETGHIYIMFDSYSLLTLGSLVRKYFDVKNLITWDKINMGMGHYFRRRHEFIIFATNGNNRKIRNRSFPDIWRFKRIHNAKYPTQKPVELFQAMIHASASDGFTVCDPFMGSGSSAIAAIKNNCKFIGSDISKRSFLTAKERIMNYIEHKKDILQSHPSNIKGETVFWE